MSSILTHLLKSVSHPLLALLKNIFTLSFSTGVVPVKHKLANVIPIFKAGDASDVSNYRPIYLQSTFSKVFEKIVQTEVVTFF